NHDSVARSVALEILGRLQLTNKKEERIYYAIAESRFEDALAEGAVGLREVFRVANDGAEEFHRNATAAISKLEDHVSPASILASAGKDALDRPDFLGIVMKFTLALIREYSGLPVVFSAAVSPDVLNALTGGEMAMQHVIDQLKSEGLMVGMDFEAALNEYKYGNHQALLYGIGVLVAVITPPITI